MTTQRKKKSKPKLRREGNYHTKLTEEFIERVCQYIRAGSYIESAVILAGMSKQSFYRLVKDAYAIEELKTPSKYNKTEFLKVKLRDSVRIAVEEATMRDLMNIDRCAMGQATVYERYPQGTMRPVKDHRGNISCNDRGEEIMVDVSGQVVMDEKGKPVIREAFMPPSYQCSMWRLERRNPKQWGSSTTFKIEREDPLAEPESEEDKNTVNVIFVGTEDEE